MQVGAAGRRAAPDLLQGLPGQFRAAASMVHATTRPHDRGDRHGGGRSGELGARKVEATSTKGRADGWLRTAIADNPVIVPTGNGRSYWLPPNSESHDSEGPSSDWTNTRSSTHDRSTRL